MFTENLGQFLQQLWTNQPLKAEYFTLLNEPYGNITYKTPRNSPWKDMNSKQITLLECSPTPSSFSFTWVKRFPRNYKGTRARGKDSPFRASALLQPAQRGHGHSSTPCSVIGDQALSLTAPPCQNASQPQTELPTHCVLQKEEKILKGKAQIFSQPFVKEMTQNY